MKIKHTPTFKKQYKKLPKKIQEKFDIRLRLFFMDPTEAMLRVHPLKGKYSGYWSMNISGDLRALFLREGEQIIIFALIGTHSQLYG